MKIIERVYSLWSETKIYRANEIDKAIKKAGMFRAYKDRKQVYYYDIPIAFDIETSSFEVQSIKHAIMYIWTLSFAGIIIQGRTWIEFVNTIKFIKKWFKLNNRRRLIIYVHNLSYEFQFMHKWFKWDDVFSLKKRQPVKAITGGIEFRCSLKLSGYKLELLAKNLTKFNIKKLVGDLDYSILRNELTPLSQQENQYCINDVQIIVAYIAEYIEKVGHIYDIPMTKTGVVRKTCRSHCYYGFEKRDVDIFKKYRKLMNELLLTPDDYIQLKNAFAGGFTHANAYYVNDIIENVYSNDFTSSYPAVMVAEKFPMSSPQTRTVQSIEQFRHYINNYACLFDITIENISPAQKHENYISLSHCRNVKNAVTNNGRIVTAESITLTITEIDYFIIEQYYHWDNALIGNFKIMTKTYLPTNLVRTILEFYKDKTELKGVKGKEAEYLNAKEMVNSIYGMCVTDICRPHIEYSSIDWTAEKPDLYHEIERNNKSLKRFLYYPWGVWVTAYARYNLFTAISELKNDYIYSDTDSVKFINYNEHMDYFNKYNSYIINKIEAALKYHKIPLRYARPKTIKGVEKPLGVWDFEGKYTRFKTLGAKRYMVEKDNQISITVSGLNKSITVPYLMTKYQDPFKAFTNEMYIPPEYTGKLTHTYIDDEYTGIVTDYLGNSILCHELSAVHLQPAEYSLSMSDNYLKYLLGKREENE